MGFFVEGGIRDGDLVVVVSMGTLRLSRSRASLPPGSGATLGSTPSFPGWTPRRPLRFGSIERIRCRDDRPRLKRRWLFTQFQLLVGLWALISALQ